MQKPCEEKLKYEIAFNLKFHIIKKRVRKKVMKGQLFEYFKQTKREPLDCIS